MGTSASMALYISVKQFMPCNDYSGHSYSREFVATVLSSGHLVNVLHRFCVVVYVPLADRLLYVWLDGVAVRANETVVRPNSQFKLLHTIFVFRTLQPPGILQAVTLV
jgi:hypothetical protein